jgi:hypothetical protein
MNKRMAKILRYIFSSGSFEGWDRFDSMESDFARTWPLPRRTVCCFSMGTLANRFQARMYFRWERWLIVSRRGCIFVVGV